MRKRQSHNDPVSSQTSTGARLLMTTVTPFIGLHIPLSHRRDNAELLHQSQIISIAPRFYDFPPCHTTHHTKWPCYLLAGGRKREELRLSGVCAPQGKSCNSFVPFDDQLVDCPLNIGEGSAHVGLEPFEDRQSSNIGEWGLVDDKIRSVILIQHIQVPFV